jgi:hypothetical protein
MSSFRRLHHRVLFGAFCLALIISERNVIAVRTGTESILDVEGLLDHLNVGIQEDDYDPDLEVDLLHRPMRRKMKRRIKTEPALLGDEETTEGIAEVQQQIVLSRH